MSPIVARPSPDAVRAASPGGVVLAAIAPLETGHALATLDADGVPRSASAAFVALFAPDGPGDLGDSGDSGDGARTDGAGALGASGLSLAEIARRRFGRSALPLAAGLAGAAAFSVRLSAAGESRAVTLQCTSLDAGRRLAIVEAEIVEPDDTASREATHVDPLTALGNRRLLDDTLAALAALATPGDTDDGRPRAALLLVDLDRFKQVNDTLGHGTGDRLLQLVAKRLRRATRPDDTLVRLGGDEFVALLRGEDPLAMAESAAARIVELVARPFLVDGQQVNIGASVGVAVLDAHGSRASDLVRHADLALYDAKRAGRGRWSVFESGLETRAIERRELELALRRALGLREFELVYQPQVQMPEGRVSGFEALIRWNHPERGLVSPLEFIPLAEEIGEIQAIGDWVLQSACLEATGWADELSVAVNVSPCQFQSGRFVDSVRAALERSGLAPARLELEITEGVLLDDSAGTLVYLEEIRALGVSIAMDDFGTGYSSLSYLNTFPFSKIKIDQAFVRGEQTPRSRALVDAIISLGASLGMQTLAEGVETESQFADLARSGCGAAQGYLISKPIASRDIDAFLAGRIVPPVSRGEAP